MYLNLPEKILKAENKKQDKRGHEICLAWLYVEFDNVFCCYFPKEHVKY